MDEIINYIDLREDEKEQCLTELLKTSFCPASGDIANIRIEMERSKQGELPQFVFVRRNKVVIGYMFLIAEKEKSSPVFPWWAVDNSDELPLETDLRLLQYGADLCRKAGCYKLEERLHLQSENHKKGIGRRNEEACV